MTSEKHNVRGTLAYAQRVAIEEALQECGYKISQAAKRLQIGRTTLYNLMLKYRIGGVEPGERLDSIRPDTIINDGREVYYLDGSWYLRTPVASLT
jgi:hypothetical protein